MLPSETSGLDFERSRPTEDPTVGCDVNFRRDRLTHCRSIYVPKVESESYPRRPTDSN